MCVEWLVGGYDWVWWMVGVVFGLGVGVWGG